MWWLLGSLHSFRRFLWILSWPNSPQPVFGGGCYQPIHLYTYMCIHLLYAIMVFTYDSYTSNIYIYRSCILKISGNTERVQIHNILELRTFHSTPVSIIRKICLQCEHMGGKLSSTKNQCYLASAGAVASKDVDCKYLHAMFNHYISLSCRYHQWYAVHIAELFLKRVDSWCTQFLCIGPI